jgi:rRNA maturation endonuclease Nob1
MIKICTKCNNKIAAPTDKFCYLCGAPLIDVSQTCSCGRHLAVYDKFCPVCGKEVIRGGVTGKQTEQSNK